jgi:ParB family chromosome partitioning protein
MHRLVESVKEYGVREPGLARSRVDGGYELICGNRRKRACELAELETMPIIIREMDDNLAIIVMVDSNLEQREKILPSEKAWAYKVTMEALNHNGVKSENHSYEIMVERTGESKNQIYRIIRLTELIMTLLDKVDTSAVGKLKDNVIILRDFGNGSVIQYLATALTNQNTIHIVEPDINIRR